MLDPLAGERLEDDDPEALEGADEESVSTSGQAMDPLAKRLVIASAVVVAAVVAMTAAIVYFASVGSKVPRTSVERDAMVALQKVRQSPKDTQAWMDLAAADIAAGKYDDAYSAIRGLSQLTKRAIVPLLKGDLANAKGDISGAREFYAQAVVQAKQDHEADVKSAVQGGVTPGSVAPSQPEAEAYIALGRLDLQVKDYDASIMHLQAALKIEPNAADTRTLLGDAQAAAGQKEAALASYKQALKFVPDYQPALDGVKQLNGGK
jgi:tetratricopeptide (TPR) repeat protein